MHAAHALVHRLEALERTVRLQRLVLGGLALCLGLVGLTAWSAPESEVVRAQRFVAVDDHGVEVGEFGFQRVGGRRNIGWRLADHETGAYAMCAVFRDPEEGVAADQGCAYLQLEAGHAISQLVVRELDQGCSMAFFTGEDEKTAARMTARGPNSEIVLASGPYLEDSNGEEDESRSLRLAYDGEGPHISGVDLEGATTLSLS